MIDISNENSYEQLKEACVALAYKVANYERPMQYEIADEQVATILICEGVKIIYE